ncbi:LysM peptidoglycan-binding domain-containing protein [Bradyrhizobium sp. RDT10]
MSKLDSALASYVIDAGQQDTNILAEHVVVSGDQLRKLAKHYYGDAEKWKIIFDANRDTIDDADELFVGWKLRIPALASTEQLTI